jgi:hypothetical protein
MEANQQPAANAKIHRAQSWMTLVGTSGESMRKSDWFEWGITIRCEVEVD